MSREADASGLAFWTGEFAQCNGDAACREAKRVNVSAAFYLSIEFQETGYFVYRGATMGYEFELLNRFAQENKLKMRPVVVRDSRL